VEKLEMDRAVKRLANG